MADASALELYDCDLDGAGMGRNWDVGTVIAHGYINVPAGSSVKLTNCHLFNAPRMYADSSGSFETVNCFTECFANYTSSDDHGETYKIDQGVFISTDSIIDANDGGPVPLRASPG
jgi:hypothetical protein